MSDEPAQVCTLCHVSKPAEAFNRNAARGGRERRCRVCRLISRGTMEAEQAATMAPFGGPIERAAGEAFARTGSIEAAAAELGLTPVGLRARLQELARMAAKRGWSPSHDMTRSVPEGFAVKGVSTLYGADGEVRQQWVKSNRDQESRLELLAAAVATIAEPFRGMAEPVPMPRLDLASDDLLNVIPLGDPHVGLYAWGRETLGPDFDLDVAEREIVAAVDHLIALAPPARECLIASLGDFYHSDNQSNRTARSGHALDVDGRWAKVLSVGIRAMRRCIDKALERHEIVRVVCEIGNHDDQSAIMLALCLSNYYEHEPRVIVDTSPAKFHWHEHGECLIGITHGDTVKKEQLGPIMASDMPEAWGRTKHRIWYTGHIHHDSVREYPGVMVESFRTLAARDAWSSAAGYRSGRDLKLDVWHKRWGRIMRHTVGIAQLERGRDAA